MQRNVQKLFPMLRQHVSFCHRKHKCFYINNNNEFVSKVINNTVPVVVNFHAEWCSPCTILTPKLIELIEPMEDLHLATVNIDLNPELATSFEVQAVPAVFVISNDLVIKKFIGLVDMNMIEDLIKQLTQKGNKSDKSQTAQETSVEPKNSNS